MFTQKNSALSFTQRSHSRDSLVDTGATPLFAVCDPFEMRLRPLPNFPFFAVLSGCHYFSTTLPWNNRDVRSISCCRFCFCDLRCKCLKAWRACETSLSRPSILACAACFSFARFPTFSRRALRVAPSFDFGADYDFAQAENVTTDSHKLFCNRAGEFPLHVCYIHYSLTAQLFLYMFDTFIISFTYIS